MKRFFVTLLLIIGVLVPSAQAQDPRLPLNPRLHHLFPARPSDYLTDLANVVKNDGEVNIRLREIRERDGLSLVAVTLPTIQNYAVEDVAREIGRRWRVATANDTIGVAVRNTGGVILLVMDSRDCRVEVATGSEGYMTDSRAGLACERAIPAFRNGNFGEGIVIIADIFATRHREGVGIRAEADEPQGSAARRVGASEGPRPPAEPLPWGMILLVVLILGTISAFLLWKAHLRAEALRVEEGRQAKIRREEAERLRREREEAERIRWNSLTPEQQARELAERERQRQEAEVRRQAILQQQRIEEEKRAEERRRNPPPPPRSSFPRPSGGGGGWKSGGSSSFGGGGGGRKW